VALQLRQVSVDLAREVAFGASVAEHRQETQQRTAQAPHPFTSQTTTRGAAACRY
jgi:hypothetical protein